MNPHPIHQFRTLHHDPGRNALRAGRAYTFTRIADTSGPFNPISTATPDSGLPSINADGACCYYAAALDAGGSGIYRLAGPHDIVPVGIDDVTVAGTGLTYSGFARGLPVINNLNQVAYWASRTAGGVAVYRSGTSVASSDNGFSELMDSPALHPNTSLVALCGSKVIVVPFSSPGIWTGTTAGTYTEVVTGTSGLSSDGPSINGLGHVAWVGTYGTHRRARGQRRRDPRLGHHRGGIFSGFLIRNARSTLRRSSPNRSRSRSWPTSTQAVRAVPPPISARAGFAITPIATDPVISVFSRPLINSKAGVVFRRVVSGGNDVLFTGPDLTADRVIGDGDALDSRTVSDVRTSRRPERPRADRVPRHVHRWHFRHLSRQPVCGRCHRQPHDRHRRPGGGDHQLGHVPNSVPAALPGLTSTTTAWSTSTTWWRSSPAGADVRDPGHRGAGS